jgi:hypothetical protein
LICSHQVRWCSIIGRGYTQTQRATSMRLPLMVLLSSYIFLGMLVICCNFYLWCLLIV